MQFCCLCGMGTREGAVHLCTAEVVSLLNRAGGAQG